MAEPTPPQTPRKIRHVATTSQFSPSRKLVTTRDSRKQGSLLAASQPTTRPGFTPFSALPISPRKHPPASQKFPVPPRIATTPMFAIKTPATASKIAALVLPTFAQLRPTAALRSTVLKTTATPNTSVGQDNKHDSRPLHRQNEALATPERSDVPDETEKPNFNPKVRVYCAQLLC